ncbi:MAG TPA: hypothetical protein VGK36_22250, partial [Candidatus Angelobacter sp.]
APVPILFWGSDLELSDIQSLNVKDVWRQFVKDVPALYTFRSAVNGAKYFGLSRRGTFVGNPFG